MDEKDALSLVITIGEDVWKNYGYLITLNIAVLGWLMQRHGLYNTKEKILATLGYSVFIAVIAMGMVTAYAKLDLAANELAYIYVKKSSKPVNKGLAENYVKKSPAYCKIIFSGTKVKCQKYSDNLNLAQGIIFLSWFFNVILFWYQGFWISIRESSKNDNKAL